MNKSKSKSKHISNKVHLTSEARSYLCFAKTAKSRWQNGWSPPTGKRQFARRANWRAA